MFCLKQRELYIIKQKFYNIFPLCFAFNTEDFTIIFATTETL